MSDHPLLQAADLRFGYVPDETVIDHFSACLTRGVLCALVGPNAAGKSTLLKLLMGHLEPWEGSVTLDGQPVAAHTPAQRAARICYVPQRSHVSFAYTVQQVAEMGRHALGPHPQAVHEALDRCDLLKHAHRVYSELSAGQQQRVLLARAFAQAGGRDSNAGLMLLDEPTSAMDLWHMHRTMTVVREHTRAGHAALVVMHDLNLAARYADEVWLIDDGKLIIAGPWRQVLSPERLSQVYRVQMSEVWPDGADRPVFSATLSGNMNP